MAFVLKKKEVLEGDLTTKAFTYKPADVTVTFKSLFTPSFQKAQSYLSSRFRNEANLPLTADMVSKQAISEDSLTFDEALIVAVGEHLAAEWDVVDEDNKKIPLTGENFVLLVSQMDSPSDFVQWCFNCAGEVAKSIAESVAETKKKPSSATSGKKNTQD